MPLKPSHIVLFVLASSNVLANQCLSANSNTPKENFQQCCSGMSSGTGAVAGYEFDYTCNKYPSASEPGRSGFKTAQACAERCATDPQCKAVAWKASSKLCAKVTAPSYESISGDGWLFLEKNEKSDKVSDNCRGQIDSATKECKEKKSRCRKELKTCDERTTKCDSEKLQSEKRLEACESSKDTLLQDNKASTEKAAQCESERTALKDQLDQLQDDQTGEAARCNEKIQQCEENQREVEDKCTKEKEALEDSLKTPQHTDLQYEKCKIGHTTATAVERILSSTQRETFVSDLRELTIFVLDDFSLNDPAKVENFTSHYEIGFMFWGTDSKYYTGWSEEEGRNMWKNKSATLLNRTRGWESELACWINTRKTNRWMIWYDVARFLGDLLEYVE
ncbi:hypothetical protein PENFLA_c011G01469 [Penicillium flavigenum]|uniref:Apple domain-containing protein n=1 Tax=Penicillium flavigenum TaxID=254877 RepID=A0A1V6TA81_9EURO|nr:hypothetical protein PENFLA_c011G01469 [Penicillium flavigenum]